MRKGACDGIALFYLTSVGGACGREGGREEGREGGREGGRKGSIYLSLSSIQAEKQETRKGGRERREGGRARTGEGWLFLTGEKGTGERG